MAAFDLILAAILALMMFSVALNLRAADFALLLQTPRAVLAGLIPQLLLLPIATWGLTMVLDLPANVELAMMLVAACPGGNTSNIVAYFAKANAALSVTLTAISSVAAIVTLPLNFAWMAASNPNTAALLVDLAVDHQMLMVNLVVMLAIPMALGLLLGAKRPAIADRLKRPLARVSFAFLLVFIVGGLYGQRELLTLALLPTIALVIGHNLIGLALGWASAKGFGVAQADRRAITIEAGMQNSALALAIIASQFQGDIGMIVLAGLWGIWHIVSGLCLAGLWRRMPLPHSSNQFGN